MVNKSDDYILCADEHSLADAITAIQSSPAVILDCEGVNLGLQGGCLSLISLRPATPPTSQTYLIDTVILTGDELRPLFDIIQSSSPTKIVFDGRMDFSELFHGYGVSMQGVLDLQLADVHSRRQRGELQRGQLRRLSPFLPSREIMWQPKSYTPLHKLAGLNQCMKEHRLIGNLGGKQSSENMHTDYTEENAILICPLVNHSSWLNRPLTEEYLRYASQDVYLIRLLYAHFKMQGYISDRLPAQSARYVAIWQDEKPQKTDKFRRHPILPLQILDHNSNSPTVLCVGCRRHLPETECPKAAGPMKHHMCWVCRAINLRG